MSMKNSSDTSGNRTSDLPICSTAPESLCYCGPPHVMSVSVLVLIVRHVNRIPSEPNYIAIII